MSSKISVNLLPTRRKKEVYKKLSTISGILLILQMSFGSLFFVALPVPAMAVGPGNGCELIVTKTDNVDPVQPGDEIVYHIVVENTGTGECTGAGVKDYYDSDTSYVGANPSPSNINSDYIRWNVGTVVPSQTIDIYLTMQVSSDAECSGTLVNGTKRWSDQTGFGPGGGEQTQIVCFGPVCGNGDPEGDEECDDGNTEDGDGCSANCTIEEELCEPGQALTEYSYGPTKPDTAYVDGSQTDKSGSLCNGSNYISVNTGDGQDHYIYLNWTDNILNLDQYDGVSKINLLLQHKESSSLIEVEMKNETGSWIQVCDPAESSSFTWDSCDLLPHLDSLDEADDIELRIVAHKVGTCHAYLKCAQLEVEMHDCDDACGNGDQEGDEECDLGPDNGLVCTPPYGGSCSYCSDTCESVELTGPYCGDSQTNGDEVCDGDEPQECIDQSGYTGLSFCEACDWTDCESDEFCGDGTVNGAEECDDGNNEDGDGCTANCNLEEIPECGDGVPEGDEECDLGPDNGMACTPPYGDSCSYCSATCNIIELFGPYCGDGQTNGDEECDGDEPQECTTQDGYTGLTTCDQCAWGDCESDERCGDGILNGNEECDGDAGLSPGEICTASCTKSELCRIDLDVMVVMDRSGSMGYDTPTRLFQAKNAANSFVDKLGSGDQSGLVSYAGIPDPDPDATLDKTLSNNHTLTKTEIGSLVAYGGTNIGDGIDLANLELMSGNANPQAIKIEILLTDGRANLPNGDGGAVEPENPDDVAYAIAKSVEAASQGIKIFTIGLGSDVNETMLQTIADNTGASYFFAPTAGDLDAVFDQIAYEVCEYGSISGCKFYDSNGDGDLTGEETLAGWGIHINGGLDITQETDGQGCYQFAGLEDGVYTITEIMQDGWYQTYPQSGYYEVIISNNIDVVDIDFGNYKLCGNNEIDDGEECDGQEGIGEHQICSEECTLIDLTYCGDDIKQFPNDEGIGGPLSDGYEDCDGEDGLIEGFSCDENCVLIPEQQCVQPDTIVINEIMQNPDAVTDGNGEWFEVYNTTGSEINLNGCTIYDNGTDSQVISGDVIVPAFGYAVLGRNTDSMTNGGVTMDYGYTNFTLGNTDDELAISCCQVDIDRVDYDGGPSFPYPAGASMILNDPANDNNDGANWCVSQSPFGDGDLGTPGYLNDSCEETCDSSISGTKRNGLTQEVMSDWTIELRRPTGELVDSTVTDIDGNYLFEGLCMGDYIVLEIQQAGWEQVSPIGPDYYTVIIETGGTEVVDRNFFNEPMYGSLKVCKYRDGDGFLETHGDQEPVESWSFTISKDQFDATQATGDDGCTTFEDLYPGDYLVSENPMPANWTAIDPATGERNIGVVAGSLVIADTFYNYESGNYGSICGHKYEDEDGNIETPNTLGLEGWTIILNGMGTCEEGDEWADSVVSYTPGSPVVAERSNPDNALGTAQYDDTVNFVSLGFGGELILEFENFIINGPGGDVSVVETSYGGVDCNAYPETVHAYASQTGADGTWVDLGTGCLDTSFSMPGSLTWAKYIKLVDITNPEDFPGGGDGFDVDGVKAQHCGQEWSELDSTVTDIDGVYCFLGLDTALYNVSEVMQNGWYNTSESAYDVYLIAPEDIDLDFSNAQETGSVCGNEIVEDGEQCDDGNTDNGDGCSSTCQLEQNPPVCGNEIVEGDEECDDGYDGSETCTPNCTLIEEPVCGNDIVEAGEQCDDGNTDNDDGCSSTCQLEQTPPVCGDGICNGDETCSTCSSDCGSCGGGGGSVIIVSSSPSEEPVVLGEEGAPILGIIKSIDQEFANPGDTEISYKIIVTNTGNLTAFDVQLEDVLPEGLTYFIDGATETSWSFGDLGAGESKEISYTVNVSESASEGIYTNTATASAANHDPVNSTANLEVRMIEVLAATGFRISELLALLSILIAAIGASLFLKRKTA